MDLLSDLPLSIIHVILSLVPIRDAVRTSILSRNWRFKWSSLPYLSFDDECVVNPPREYESDDELEFDEEIKIDEKRLIHFISQTLLLHDGPIHKFQLCLPPMVESQCINQWLRFLSRNGIKNLLLESDDINSGIEVHSVLYSCQSLTNLKLHGYYIPPPPPSFKGFMFLKSFDIFVHEVHSSAIESVVAHSPLLEELKLNFCCSKLTIHALNLKYLHFRNLFYLSLCTPLLQELSGCFNFTEHFSIGAEFLVFRHLRTIKLFFVPLNNEQVTPAVFRLITGSPNLQKLEIEAWDSFQHHPPEVAYLWDIESAPDFTYNSLKMIKIKYSHGFIDEMNFIEFLLARSPLLENMIYQPYQPISPEKLQKLTTQVLGYHRASANAQIVVVNRRR